MSFESEDLAICETCGTQYDVPYSQAPSNCRICDDPRQYVPPGGQVWTSLAREKGKHENVFVQDKFDERIWFITSEPKLGIGERCILLRTPHGNILWDLITYLDTATITRINSLGGLSAIIISHPHFYTTHLEWAAQFKCPVYTAAADAEWLNREDKHGVRKLVEGKGMQIPEVEGSKVTAIVAGGHFDGSMILHWEGRIFIADTMMSVPSGLYHQDRLPGTTTYAFMWSYPNMIPLPPSKIHGIWLALKPFAFEASYGGFMGQNVVRADLKEQVLESMKICVRTAGHESAEIYGESL
ncbi:hypothetical protein P154DRAFT_173095 [Amniculicola lignicola CBS 123094]|uniref:Metallo-beta-lactamase domain-containing protein n=1 Tax=Amniculicola lignicola CBS 123094 TaxID=1392246 RepID=A0A6A5WH08_9PLEO|nr:hypothetical protein P154DRAFT_173095 [Amniculicola lignicola CBS 123094]